MNETKLSKLVISLDEFHVIYSELLPWLNNPNLEEMIKCVIDDVNGLLTVSRDVGLNRSKEDFTEMSKTVSFLCRQCPYELSTSAIVTIKEQACALMWPIVRNIARGGLAADCVFMVDSIKFSEVRGNTLSKLRIVLIATQMYNYGPVINQLIGELSYEILNAFENVHRNKRFGRRSRPHSK